MRERIRTVSIWAGALAALAMAALLVIVFTRQGTLGLFQWLPEWRTIFVCMGAFGALPIVVAAVSRLAIREDSRKLGPALAWTALALAVLAVASSAAFFSYILGTSRAIGAPVPALNLVDPSKGLTAADGVLRLSISSDPHWDAETADPEARSAILGSVAAAKPRRDAFFILGDNVERGMDDAPWREEIEELGAALGDLPIRPLMGNHDGVIDGEYHYKTYFMPPRLGTDSGSPFYYSMSAGPATIVVLNLLWGTESFDARQRAWLERTLAALPEDRQVIVLSHCFFYSSGYVSRGMDWFDHEGTIGEVAPILERHGVDLVVSGHNHYLELLRKNGVTYAVVGGMGGLLDPEPTYDSPASIWIAQGVFGRLDLDIGKEGIAMTFRDRDGEPLREEFLPARGRESRG